MAFQSSLSPVLLMSSLLGNFFLVTNSFRLTVYFVRCLPLLLIPQIFPLNICFFSPSALFLNCRCLFLMVLSRDLLYPGISITSSFDFFSVLDILIIPLMYHISAASGLLSRSLVSVRIGHNYVGFQRVDFCANSDISVGEDGLQLVECFFRQSYSFLYLCVASGIWSYCEAQVFKGAYLFYSFPFAKNVTYRSVWLLWEGHALSLLCIQLKSVTFHFRLWFL